MRKTLLTACAAMTIFAAGIKAQTVVLENGGLPECIPAEDVYKIEPFFERQVIYAETEEGKHLQGVTTGNVIDLGLSRLWIDGGEDYLPYAAQPLPGDLSEFAQKVRVIKDWQTNDLIVIANKLSYGLNQSEWYENPYATKDSKSSIVPSCYYVFRPVSVINMTDTLENGMVNVQASWTRCYDDRFKERAMPWGFVAECDGTGKTFAADDDFSAKLELTDFAVNTPIKVYPYVNDRLPYAAPSMSEVYFFNPDLSVNEYVIEAKDIWQSLYFSDYETFATRQIADNPEFGDDYIILNPRTSTASPCYTIELPEMMYGTWDVYIEASPVEYREEDGELVGSKFRASLFTKDWTGKRPGAYNSNGTIFTPPAEYLYGANYFLFPTADHQSALIGTFTHESYHCDDRPLLQLTPSATSKEIRNKEFTKSMKLHRIVLKRHKAE